MKFSVEHWQTKLLTRWRAQAIAPLAAMSERDRMALLFAGLALVGAVDWFVVLPMNHQRDSIVQAALAEAQAAVDAAAQAEQERTQALAALTERSRTLDADLAKLGMAQTSGQQLSALLAQALRQPAVEVIGLRETAAEAISADQTANGSPQAESSTGTALAAATTGDQSQTAATPPEPAAATPVASLFRHRFELRLMGEVPALMVALTALEREVKPLRISRVRLEAAEGNQARLTLALVVLSTERVWLSL